MYIMSKKFKKLTLQYAYLQIELEEVTEACLGVESEIKKYMEEHYPKECKEFYSPSKPSPTPESTPENDNEKNNEERLQDDIDPVEETEEKEEIQVSIPPRNKDLKKLYRKIAEKTHPDKVGGNQYAHLFSSAAKAYSENDIGTLLNLAGSLNIELTELSEASILLLEENIDQIAMDIYKRKKTTAWSWKNATSDEQKNEIIEHILKTKGIIIQ